MNVSFTSWFDIGSFGLKLSDCDVFGKIPRESIRACYLSVYRHTQSKDKTALASFALPDEPVQLAINQLAKELVSFLVLLFIYISFHN